MADPRRDYSLGRSGARLGTLGRAGARLGKLWLGDWDAAHSPWADQFDLIINCCHKEGKYRRWPIRDTKIETTILHTHSVAMAAAVVVAVLVVVLHII